MSEYGYTLSEHDPERPWIVFDVGHRTVEQAPARSCSPARLVRVLG